MGVSVNMQHGATAEGSLCKIDHLRGRKKTCPAAGAEQLHDVDCFLSQVADLHSGESAAAEFINGQTR